MGEGGVGVAEVEQGIARDEGEVGEGGGCGGVLGGCEEQEVKGVLLFWDWSIEGVGCIWVYRRFSGGAGGDIGYPLALILLVKH